MIFGLQFIGILFALVMIYFTFLYYKREQYDKRGFIVWLIIWVGFMIMVTIPQTIYGVMEALQIKRTVDFFVIGGFLIFSVILFRMYIITKQTQKKVEDLVRDVAIKGVKIGKKTNK
ncbi:DUF2304 domain-containing protein [Candidatus Woesearchaeota archaeon]|nr:DUF2304 domain-containing protein [Candidatus Woesearchaeota archaeon]MBT3538454.1 DUF2304 domain-containing protein [Candidatus Woesearchaeota archaeon]MBT4697017.1 DUF2304 domain-containing protein [Candidatus Woesearchaeota archaeon]MBT7106090.1 DUF2304 domain-containing protein [Candidatus Woesearchaeota archaeon]MBT7931012.1 DUF2304 domain-containing protein [Candidatus Woesearchaeota archaeon]